MEKTSMNILFDLNHPVDVNFFKNTILKLNSKGYDIIVVFRSRGKLKKILEYELGQFKIVEVGKHDKSTFGKITGQVKRDIDMFNLFKKEKIDLVVSFGGVSSVAARFARIPYLDFDDDFEYKLTFYRGNIFSTRHIMPAFITFDNKKTYKYKGFKELAYLHPKYFQFNKEEIEKNGLLPNEYIFIRLISSVSLNYKEEKNNFREVINEAAKIGLKIVVSLEDDELKKQIQNDCIFLKEPVNDLYSIMKGAAFIISSGDTMARESCLLSVPCIYIGGREMAVNDELINMGAMFFETDVDSIVKRMKHITGSGIKEQMDQKINDKIKNEWEDTTVVILKHVNEFLKK